MVRLFGGVTTEDIENEARAISKLCGPGTSRYIVEVIKHGWLPRDKTCYFIDMELCSKTLEQGILERKRTNLWHAGVAVRPWATMLEWILPVATHLALGLAHIHRAGAVHRDLKPRNGNQSFEAQEIR